MNWRNLGLALSLIAGLAPAAGRADWSVWTSTATERLLRDAPPGQNQAVELAAARNESESFQVFLRADAPVKGVNLQPGNLVAEGGAVLPASRARLYRQHQFELVQPTHRNDQFQPGWYPDALIPFNHPLSGEPLAGARLDAAPFDLPPAETHGFWIDLEVPADAKPGRYHGTYRVTTTAADAVEIPVTLTVWDFALPRVSTMHTALGSPAERMRGYYARRAKQEKEQPPEDWAAVERQVAELLTRHRINATPPSGSLRPEAQPDGSFLIPAEQIEAARAFVDRYHVNALPIPHPRTAVKDPEAEKDRLHAWLRAWDRAANELDRPQVLFYTYLRDEPNDEEAYQYVQKWGRAIRAADSVVKVLVVEQTWTQKEAWGDLYGAVDIWCPLFSLFKPETAAARLALGERVWTYTALCQGKKTPWWHTDFPLLNYRVPAWIAWRYRITGLLYWGGMSYWSDVDDPWTDPGTLDRRDRRKELLYNGEGSLVYPGRAVGYEGIAPSLRLKAIRDGIEDYELLAILERLGRRGEAEDIVLPLAASWFEWNPNPADYQAARSRLAQQILAAAKK
ncbi:MAG: DUF4091 domain-containing protein [Pirellulales bacterium]|jgi:hypothetical protein|nr:DUF4091 domain-containing protein [Pirellulales bacterium]